MSQDQDAAIQSVVDYWHTPEGRKEMMQALVADCREKIRAGNEASLWEYIEVQWPEAVLDEFQKDILRSGMLGGIKGIAIKGCTSPGKGFAVALLANCWFDVHSESKVIVTSSSIEHAKDTMFGEIKAVRSRMQWPGDAKVMTEEFRGQANGKDDPKHFVKVANPDSGESFSGAHGPATLFIFDEASATPDMLYENALQQALLIVALSNPRTLSGWFRDLFRPAPDPNLTQTVIATTGAWRLITVGGMDCRNVREKRLAQPFGPLGGIDITLGTETRHFNQAEKIPPEFFAVVKTKVPNQMDWAKYVQTMASKSEFTRSVFGEGKFPKEDAESQLYLESWFQRHYEAWVPDIVVEALGLDVAASKDGDETVLTAGGFAGIRKQHTCRKSNTIRTVEWVIEVVKEDYGIDLTQGRVPIGVDLHGIGKGVHENLIDRGVNAIAIWGSGHAETDKKRWLNRRAECYGVFAERLNPECSPEKPFGLPPSEKLLEQELCAHHKHPRQNGMLITPKDRFAGMQWQGHTVKEHLGRSPDRSDSAVYFYAALCSLEDSGASTLRRPLLLISPEEEQAELEAAAKREIEKSDDEREKERIAQLNASWKSEFDALLPIPPDEIPVKEQLVEMPSFLFG